MIIKRSTIKIKQTLSENEGAVIKKENNNNFDNGKDGDNATLHHSS
jgi:hypothetical protein